MRIAWNKIFLLAMLMTLRADAFFRASALDDSDATRRQVLELGPVSLGLLSRESYFGGEPAKDTKRKLYRSHIVSVLRESGWTEQASESAASDVMRIETLLAEAMPSAEQRRNVVPVEMTIPELQSLAPRFQWANYFRGITHKPPTTIAVESKLSIVALDEVLANASSFAVRAYLRFRLIESLPSLFISSSAVAERAQFLTAIGGRLPGGSRSARCVDQVELADESEVLSLYLQRFVPPHTTENGTSFVKAIEAQMREEIEASKWLSKATRERGLQKIDRIANNIGYEKRGESQRPARLLTDAALIDYTLAMKHFMRSRFSQVGQPIDRTAAYIGPFEHGGSYIPERNEIDSAGSTNATHF